MVPIFRCLLVCVGLTALQASAASPDTVYFEPNTGPQANDVLYFARGLTYSLELTHTAIVMRFLNNDSLRMCFPHAELSATGRLPGTSNYYLETPRTGVPHFARMRYRSVFPGVDMEVYNGQSGIEYDWILAPNADPSVIRFSFNGASDILLDRNGDLVLETSAGRVRHRIPRIYQRGPAGERDIAGSFVLDGSSVRFRLGEYDHHQPLIIDPQIVFAAAFGRSYRIDSGTLHVENNSTAFGVALDRAGNAYVSASEVNCASCISVNKLNPQGTQILYSTVIATAQLNSRSPGYQPISPNAIASDPDGNVYLTALADNASLAAGGTRLTSAGGIDVMLAKLDSDGKLRAVMTIGGSKDDGATAITIGPDGYLYLTGTTMSEDFPVTGGALRASRLGSLNFFAVKVDPKLLDGETPRSRAVVYSALIGTYSVTDIPINATRIEQSPMVNIGVDASGNAYVSAYTDCTGLTATPGALQTTCHAEFPDRTAAVLKLDRAGASILWTAIPSGSTSAFIDRLAITPQGGIYIAGNTAPGFPVTSNAFRRTALTGERTTSAFVATIKTDGSGFGYATYLDGCCQVNGLAVDSGGNAVIAGSGGTSQFPIIGGFQSQPGSYLCVLKPDGAGLVWSTFLGNGYVDNLALDATGNVFVAGSRGINPGKATSPGSGNGPVSVLKISPDGAPAVVDGVTDSATFRPGLPLSGGLASVFAHGLQVSGQALAPGPPFPRELAGVQVLVGGVPAPIFSISNIGTAGAPGSQQINIQVPFETSLTNVEVRHQGLSGYAVPYSGNPGIFMLPDGSGAIQHAANYELVTPRDPARNGEVVIVYATGLGAVTPFGATGAAAAGPAAVPSSSCGLGRTGVVSNAGDVLYAGLAPAFPGLYQVNIRVNSNLPPGLVSLNITVQTCYQIGVQRSVTNHPSNSVPLPIQ